MLDETPLVFISYSHDSDEHRERVLRLSERLRWDGADTILDLYVQEGTPAEGWPRWMLNGLDKATHVLCICTETYYRRFRGLEVPGKGRGVDWEGALITQELYNARSVSTKFIPVLFQRSDESFVPEPMRGQTFYLLDSDASYEALYDALLNQAGWQPGPLGSLKRKPPATAEPLTFDAAATTGSNGATAISPNGRPSHGTPGAATNFTTTQLSRHAPKYLFGRDAELSLLDEVWADQKLNVFSLVAWGGAGKTSLVFHWVQTRFATQNRPDVARYFDWSFYSQGTGDSRQTSADLFISRALQFFGDPDPSAGSGPERGERLAGLIRQQRTLLVLDGIEPLQYPLADPQAGRLKDPALESLLRGLAFQNPGLVIITSREHLTDIEPFATTREVKLDKLSAAAGVALLRHLQLVGTDHELSEACTAAGGHALTLQLLGRFIADAFPDKDIRHYKEVQFEEADRERQGRSAFKVMQAYEKWLLRGEDDRQRELSILRLTGLFDRPISNDCLHALRAAPVLPGITDGLVDLPDRQWQIAIKRLASIDLLSMTADGIDAHPLIREYFSQQLRARQPDSFKAAHGRMFDHLCATTPHRPDDLEGLQPLYQAVVHGCLADRQQEARANVYRDRILRGKEAYSTHKLGAIGADLSAVAAFFEQPWNRVSERLKPAAQTWLLHEAAYSLWALGRLTEALQPMLAALKMRAEQEDWKNAAIVASNLSELQLSLGVLDAAVTDGQLSVRHADQSGDLFQRMVNLTTAADALQQRQRPRGAADPGDEEQARRLFEQAEALQQEVEPKLVWLYSLRGYRYCDLLLSPVEQTAWRCPRSDAGVLQQAPSHTALLVEVEARAEYGLAISIRNNWLLNIGLDHLTLARVALYRWLLSGTRTRPLVVEHLQPAVDYLRRAGQQDHLTKGLLTAAIVAFLQGDPDRSKQLLSETQLIAERGPMPLVLADVHLHRARLFRDREQLQKARDLIEKHHYGRRFVELEDAERAI